MTYRDFYKTHRPFDKLRKKRTGSRFDALDFHGRDIDLRSIAGVVEAGRRTDRKAGETDEDRIEELAERRDALARADAAKEFYGGPKFNAERFAKANKIDMNLRFDPKYAHPDPIVAKPPKTVPPPTPKPKPSFQEVMYPKKGAPAIPQPAAQPPKPKTKPTFQEAPYPKQNPVEQGASSDDQLLGGAGNDTLLHAGGLTSNRNRGNNVPAHGEEAKAAYQRELHAAKKAAEARGERFDEAEFFMAHGEPMIERAQAARAIKEAGEKRQRSEQKIAEENHPAPAMGTDADKDSLKPHGDDAGFFEEVYDGVLEGYDTKTQGKDAILLVRDQKLLSVYDEINAGKSADKVLAENDDLSWDVQYYVDHPELRSELYAKIKEDVSANTRRIAQLSEQISAQESGDISLARKIGRELYPGVWDVIFGLVPVYGSLGGGHNKGLGESIVEGMKEADVDLRSERSIRNFLSDQNSLRILVERAQRVGVNAGRVELLNDLIVSGKIPSRS